jgi:hypothetical protein
MVKVVGVSSTVSTEPAWRCPVMSISRLLLGLSPWFAFSLLTHRLGANSAGFAALIAAAIAAYLAYAHRAGRNFDILEVGAVLTFSVIATIAFLGGQPTDDWLANYGRGIASLVLAAIMFLSAVTVPFTERYARTSVAEKYWQTPEFRATNRRISLAWACAVSVMGVGHILAGAIDPLTHEYGVAGTAQPSRLPDLLLNWGVPIAMIFLVTKYTTRAADTAPPQSPAT